MGPTAIVIQRATPRHFAEWLRMRCALWPQATRANLKSELAAYAKRSRRRAVFLAIRPDGRAGAFLEATLRDTADGCDTSPVGYLEGWYVDPDLRRAGVGRRLVAAAEAWARSRGCTEMASDTDIGNRVSEAAHAALGYRVSSRVIAFVKPLARARKAGR